MRSAIATLVLVLALFLFVSAGVWQLGRAGQKHDLQAAFSAGTLTESFTAPVNEADATEYRFRRFELFGHYLAEQQILLDSIVMTGRSGYQVLTPFYTNGQTVLVNRGWVPANLDRRILPSVDVDNDDRSIVVRLNFLPVPGMQLTAAPETGWPRRMLYPTRDEIVAAISTPVPDYQFLLAENQTDGYLRDWQANKFGPEKHYGYAFQWFAFAGLALIFYVLLVVRWRKPSSPSVQSTQLKP